MPSRSSPPPSNSKVDKAGSKLRKIIRGDIDISEASDPLEVLIAWRAAHAVPLQSATMGLRSRVNTAGCAGQVSQRLKRIPTILDKLQREPQMALSKMADIGGCRAVLADIDEVRRVQARFKGGMVVKVRDYIADPKPSGYRAVHVVVNYSGRFIEVQLRTHTMHEWAYVVETMSGRLGVDVKSGRGPQVVQDWFQAISEAMSLEEASLVVGETLRQRIDTLRGEALPHLRGGRL